MRLRLNSSAIAMTIGEEGISVMIPSGSIVELIEDIDQVYDFVVVKWDLRFYQMLIEELQAFGEFVKSAED